MRLPTIHSPRVCHRAWVKFLRGQGATFSEIAAALGLTKFEAARMAVRSRY